MIVAAYLKRMIQSKIMTMLPEGKQNKLHFVFEEPNKQHNTHPLYDLVLKKRDTNRKMQEVLEKQS